VSNTFHALLVFVSTVGAATEGEERTTGDKEARKETVRIVVGFEGVARKASRASSVRVLTGSASPPPGGRVWESARRRLDGAPGWDSR
jgi:hypothetical protein